MNWEIVSIVLGLLGTLIGVIYAALLWEVRKLRKQGHTHAQRLTEHEMMIALIRRKLDL